MAGSLSGVAGNLIEKEQRLDPALMALKAALNTPGAVNLNVEKNPALIKFLEKAYGLEETGKPNPVLLSALGLNDITELNGGKVADAISKLQADGKIGPNAYKKDGDSSYLHALSDAMKQAEQSKVANVVGSLLGGLAGQMGIPTGGMGVSINFNSVKMGLDAALPPRTAQAPAVTPTGEPVAQAPAPAAAPPAAPTGPMVLTNNTVNEKIHELKGLLAKLEHAGLTIIPGQPSPVITFLEKAHGLPETGRSSAQLLQTLGIKNIRELDGPKLVAVVEKLQEEGKFAQGADPSFAQSILAAAQSCRPDGFSTAIIRTQLEIKHRELERALKASVGAKVSLDTSEPIVAAAYRHEGGLGATQARAMPHITHDPLAPTGGYASLPHIIADGILPSGSITVRGGVDRILAQMDANAGRIGAIVASAQADDSFADSLENDPKVVKSQPATEADLAVVRTALGTSAPKSVPTTKFTV